MKFCFRLRLRKKKTKKKFKHQQTIGLFDHYQPIERRTIDESNNMTLASGDGKNDDSRKLPIAIDEQQIAHAQDKVERLMNVITDTYERTLVRNLRLEDLDMRSTDLFRDAEKMKNMAHKMQEKFFWEDKYCMIVAIASASAIALGGLLALIFIPRTTGN